MGNDSITLCDARIGPPTDGVTLFLEPGEYSLHHDRDLGVESVLRWVKSDAHYTHKVLYNEAFRLQSSTIGIFESSLVKDLFNNNDEEFYQWKLNNVFDNNHFKHVKKFLEPYFFIKLETQHQGDFPLQLVYENDSLCGFHLLLHARKQRLVPIEPSPSCIRILQRT